MRVLFTSTPGYGHFHPLVPFAQALRDVGHEVAVAAPTNLTEAIASAGFRHFPAGLPGNNEAVYPQILAVTGRERQAIVQREVFAGLRPRQTIPDLLAITATWPPDLIVREAREYAACLVAEHLGLPHATVGISAIGDLAPADRIAAPLADHRTMLGLPPDPQLAMLHRYLTLRSFPPSLQHPAAAVAPTTHYLRPMLGDRSGPEELPAWVHGLPDRPVVYVGLGTAMNLPEIFRAFIAGLRDEPWTVIVTVGRDQDPADYGPQPDNVHIERYIPLSLLLRHCDLVVTNGGSGTLTAALAHGLPMVLVPVTADQPDNADRCAALGLGVVIQRADLTPEIARSAVRTVFDDQSCRAVAERLRDEVAALPGPEHAVELLERLARERTPLSAS